LRLQKGAENDRKLFHVKPNGMPMHAKHHALTTLLLTTTVTAIAQHAGFPDIPYTHHDWEIACDNTRTCRAAGYQADDAERNASILLTRAAGPSTAVQAQLQLEVTDEPVPKRVRMRIDGLDLGDIALKEAKATLSPSQTRALLNVLPTAKQLAWAAGARRQALDDLRQRRQRRAVEDGRVSRTARYAGCTDPEGKQSGVVGTARPTLTRNHSRPRRQ
jgi:hypothetical protein